MYLLPMSGSWQIIDIFVHGDLTIYIFKDAGQAKEFFELNHANISAKPASEIRELNIRKDTTHSFSLSRAVKVFIGILLIIFVTVIIQMGTTSSEIEEEYELLELQKEAANISKELDKFDVNKQELWEIALSVGDKGIQEPVQNEGETKEEYNKRWQESIMKFAHMDKTLLREKGESSEEFKIRFNSRFESLKQNLQKRLSEINEQLKR